jgi:hypothetical protein
LSGTVVFHLPLGNHVRHLDATEQDAGAPEILEPEHGSGAPLDRAVILLDDVVQVLRLADLMGVSRSTLMDSSAARLAPLLSIVTVSGSPF